MKDDQLREIRQQIRSSGGPYSYRAADQGRRSVLKIASYCTLIFGASLLMGR
jgi:hypothetical protein